MDESSTSSMTGDEENGGETLSLSTSVSENDTNITSAQLANAEVLSPTGRPSRRAARKAISAISSVTQLTPKKPKGEKLPPPPKPRELPPRITRRHVKALERPVEDSGGETASAFALLAVLAGALKLPNFFFLDLELSLQSGDDQLAIDIYCKMLRAMLGLERIDITSQNWEEYAINVITEYGLTEEKSKKKMELYDDEPFVTVEMLDAAYVETSDMFNKLKNSWTPYANRTPTQRAQFLYTLCEAFADSDRGREMLAKFDPTELRVQPLGIDVDFTTYWSAGDHRLYCQLASPQYVFLDLKNIVCCNPVEVLRKKEEEEEEENG
eukprot:m.47115 g.47115  ORF g.47115 m.47115 type:complete len:325 (+) comp7311_c0_seq1:202-1176(+)